MNKYTFFLFILLVFGLVSCEKESEQFPQFYSSVSVTNNVVRLFTKDGEITNSSVKDDFLNRFGDFIIPLYGSIDSMITATYINPDAVVIKKVEEIGFDTLTVHTNRDLIYWEEKDTSLFLKNSFRDLLVYKPLYFEELDYTYNNITFKTDRFLNCHYLRKVGNNLEYPMVRICYQYTRNQEVHYYIAGKNNKFNTANISQFSATDTILICEYNFILTKQ